jgi:nitronate monooxygenase
LIGSRFWASSEALVNPVFQKVAASADGDSTIRTTVVDVVRKLDWPKPFTARVMKNRFVETWHGCEADLAKPSVVDREMERYVSAIQSGDPDNTAVWVGEATGLIKDVRAAGDLLREISHEAERLLRDAQSHIV